MAAIKPDSLDEQVLHEQAVARAGYRDFGDNAYRIGLGVLLNAAQSSPRRDLIAPWLAESVVATLASRLHSEAGWAADPECLANPIVAPLVITGIPRSGTTALHQLLSMDEQFQWIPRWIGEAPMARPSRAEWARHSHYRAANARLEATFAANPGLRTAHNMGADLADECITVMMQDFVSNAFVSSFPLPDYREWFFSADETPSYRRYADNLRLVGAGTPVATWLLKNPSHTFGMESLLTTFPDARVIVLHRNPVETIASGASLIYRLGRGYWRKEELGPVRLDVFSRAVERMEEARRRHPGRCLDIDYRAFIADPMAAVRTIYRRYDLVLTPASEAAMTGWLAENPQGKHGEHRYAAEEYGITDGQVRKRFADYIARHGLARLPR